MLAATLKFLGGFVSQELLKVAFRKIILEGSLELLAEFVKKTDNPYDDKLVEKFQEFLAEQDGDAPVG